MITNVSIWNEKNKNYKRFALKPLLNIFNNDLFSKLNYFISLNNPLNSDLAFFKFPLSFLLK